MRRAAAKVRRKSTSFRPTTATTQLVRVLVLACILGLAVLPWSANCFIARVMRPFLCQKKRVSRCVSSISSRFLASSPTTSLLVQAADNPSSAQSCFDRHSRLFSSSSSSTVSSSSSSAFQNDHPMSTDGDDNGRPHTDYEKWVRRLYMTNMFHPVKMGLTNMQKLHDIMGNPMDHVRNWQ